MQRHDEVASRRAIRNQLAEALPESLGPVGLRRRAVPALGIEDEVTGYGDALLDALTPAVDAIADERARQRAAEELRKLAREALEDTPGVQRIQIPVSALFERAAAALRGER